MRYPSVKTLQLLPGIDADKAKQIRAILTTLKREQICEQYSAADSYLRSCYNEPDKYMLKLYAIDQLMEGYGIEAIDIPAGSFNNCQTPRICIEYVNIGGDAYTTTLCRVTDNRRGTISYRVCSYGDLVERYDTSNN